MMATWADLEAADAELAALAWTLLAVPGFGFGYLATVRADGGPRVHPVMPFIVDGRLELFVVPSPKLEDLRRDGRWALHSTGSETVNDELYVTGTAVIIDDPTAGPRSVARRSEAVATYPGSVAEDHALLELSIERLLVAHYATPPRWPPTYRRWAAR
jgi:hypothetical protein